MRNIFKEAYNKIENHFIRNAGNGKILVEAFARRGVTPDTGNLSDVLDRAAKTQQAQTIQKWTMAVAMATDPYNPDRSQLVPLYDNLMLDNHLASLFESRILYSQRSAKKMVDKDGNEDKEASALLDRLWFDDLVYKVIFYRAKGTTLLELYKLNTDGELAEIGEIPQSHFNAAKGIIVKAPGNTTGWDYKEGIYAPYYAQIGKDDELGMLERLAPIVLAKKLALGSWLDYIEKFGVPPLFITTDREDEGRLTELFNAASKFKSNHFMIGRGQEKFEIGKDHGGGIAPFDSLTDRANQEMSKRVLGGAGITDEKAFVGSAEIQFRLTKDRYESDKLLFKYVFNNLIKPRLVALSPVYSRFDKLTFDWDDTENMTKKEIIDAAVSLGSVYEIDPEWIFQQTGIPVLGAKQDTQPTDPSKK